MAAQTSELHDVPERPGAETFAPLTEADVVEAVRINSPALVQEIYELTGRQIAAETGRQARLDAKAASLLTTLGLSLTVIFTFGGQLLATRLASPHSHRIAVASLLVVALTMLSGLAAAFFAVRALTIRGSYLGVHERAIFNTKQIREADQVEDDDDQPDAAAVTHYRRNLLPGLAEIWLSQQKNQNEKARLIGFGQWAFLGFMAGLAIISVLVGVMLVA